MKSQPVYAHGSDLPQVCEPPPYVDGLHVVGDEEKKGPAISTAAFWRKKKMVMVGVLVAVVIIAVVVGSTVGVLTRKSSNEGLNNSDGASQGKDSETSTATNTSSTPASSMPFGTPTTFTTASAAATACSGQICPSILAAARPSPDAKEFFLFARGKNQEYYYRETDGEYWINDWQSLGGQFTSQPAAVSISEGRIDIFGIWDEDLSMRTRSYTNGTWSSQWQSLEGKCFSTPTVCSMRDGRMDLFTLSSTRQLAHKFYEGGEWNSLRSDGRWHISTGFVASSPVVSCGGDGRMDVTVYGNQEAPFKIASNRWNQTKFAGWRSYAGNYQGDPAAIATDVDMTDFLGLGEDKEMLHVQWKATDDLSKIPAKGIGGQWESVASLVSAKSGRLDAFVIGQDGKLYHKAMIDSVWEDEWENLGGAFNSAPLALSRGNGSLIVFGIGPDDSIIHSAWEVGSQNSLGEGKWYSDGGTMITSWYRNQAAA